MNASQLGRQLVGSGWLVPLRSEVWLMLLPSSPPAQAASAIGSNNIIAARLADIPNATRLQRFDAPRRF
jgi:hypothetical protein